MISSKALDIVESLQYDFIVELLQISHERKIDIFSDDEYRSYKSGDVVVSLDCWKLYDDFNGDETFEWVSVNEQGYGFLLVIN